MIFLRMNGVREKERRGCKGNRSREIPNRKISVPGDYGLFCICFLLIMAVQRYTGTWLSGKKIKANQSRKSINLSLPRKKNKTRTKY